jgi:hypothetical protein
MTLLDGFFVGMAALQVIAVGVMGFVAARCVETAKSGQSQVQPALQEVKALAETGKAFANHARADGMTAMNRVKSVTERVKQRVETTKRIAGELKPHTQTTITQVRTTTADLVHTAQQVSSLTQRLSRLKSAAEAAAQAARTP